MYKNEQLEVIKAIVPSPTQQPLEANAISQTAPGASQAATNSEEGANTCKEDQRDGEEGAENATEEQSDQQHVA